MTSAARVDRLDTVIAFTVATISIISAVVAGRAAVWSSTASDIDSIVFQEAIEARQLESDLDIAAASDLRLAARYDAAAQRQLVIAEEASARWESDPQAAARLDLAAQAEWAVDLALWRFFRMSVPDYDADGRLLFDVQRSIAAQRAADARLTELGRSPTPARAEDARNRAIALVAVAVFFVAALFVLTVAEVWPGRRRWAPLLVGVSIALIAAGATIVVDPDTAILVAAILAAAGVVLVATIGVPARRRRLAAQAASTAGDTREAGSDSDPGPVDAGPEGALPAVEPARIADTTEPRAQAPLDGATDPDERRGPLRATVVVVLAAATLLGATVAYLQSAASDAGAAATNQAQQQALLALTEHQRTAARASADLEVWSLVEEHRARAAGARQLARYLDGVGEVDAGAEATTDAARWDRAAAEADALTVLSDDHPDGPSADPRFPARFLARQVEARSARVARQDLANEAAAGWGARGAAYVAVLATIAIAAYLLGLSLILRREGLRRLFAIVGAGLVAAAGVAAAATALERDTTPDLAEQEAIARAFARGRVAAEAARAPAERSAAVEAYREVVAMHPTLARAHVELASALFDESSPQSSGYLSVATIEAVEAALAELEAARDLGWDDLATRGNLGFYQMLVGLARPMTGLTDDAVANSASALELGPELPVLRYNLAAALLADQQVDDARSAYAEAIAATVARDGDGEPRFTEAERAGVVAGAITDLELIAAARPDDPVVTSAAAEITAAIVAGTGDPIPADRAGAPVTVSGLELLADPASLWWRANIEGLDAERDSVSVLWLVEDPAVPGWHVLPNHSGPLRLGGWTTAGEFYVDGAAPGYWASQSHLLASDPQRCVPDGRYRLELFVNGQRAAGPVIETLDMPELVSEIRPDLGVLFCRPADWQRGADRRGDSVLFTREDGSPALVVTRVHRPNPPDDADANEVIDVLDAVAKTWPGKPGRAVGIEPVDAYLMGLEDAAVMWYEGTGGTLKVFGGATAQGTVVAVGLAGTAEWVDGEEASDIVGSFVLQ